MRLYLLALAALWLTTSAGAAATVETVASLRDSPAALEGLVADAGGRLWITSDLDSTLLRVSQNGGKVDTVPMPAHVQVIVRHGDGFVVTAHDNDVVIGPTGPEFPKGALPRLLVLDRVGRLIKSIKGPDRSFFNGVTPAAGGYLIADSNGGTIWKADIEKGVITPWLQHASAASPRGPGFLGGANGIKTHGGWVYYSSAGAIYRVKIGSDNRPEGEPVVFAKIGVDDFDFAPDGALYAPSGKGLSKINPTGEVTQIIDLGVNCTTAMMAPDGKSVLLLTRGTFPGMPVGPAARLLRVRLDH